LIGEIDEACDLDRGLRSAGRRGLIPGMGPMLGEF